MSPVDGKYKLFESKEEVYKELEMCYDELIEKRIEDIGETLYIEHFYFANTYELIDKKIQQRIKEYNYCKAFKCPPFPSLNETPAKVVDEFLEIENIMINIRKEKNV